MTGSHPHGRRDSLKYFVVWGLVFMASPFAARGQTPPPPNPQQPVDYLKWLNEQHTKEIKQNAADGYQAVFDAQDKAKPPGESLDEKYMKVMEIATKPQTNPWTAEERGVLKEWLRENEKLLANFAAATRVKDCYFRRSAESGEMHMALLPHASRMRGMARIFAARAKLRLTDGDADGAAQDLAVILRAGNHMRMQPSLIEYLVGVALSVTAYNTLQEMPRLAGKPVDWEAVLNMLGKDDVFTPARPLNVIRAEKLTAWDILQRYGRDKNGDGKWDAAAVPGATEKNQTFEFPPDLPTGLKELEALYEKSNALFGGDYGTAMRAAKTLETELSSQKEKLLVALMPSFWQAAQFQRGLVAERSAAHLIPRMHGFHAKNGRWPKDLQEAAAGEPADIRQDPFSGKDFGYRLENGQPLLYSVGRNGKDDGGQRAASGKKWDETGDTVFWPLVEK